MNWIRYIIRYLKDIITRNTKREAVAFFGTTCLVLGIIPLILRMIWLKTWPWSMVISTLIFFLIILWKVPQYQSDSLRATVGEDRLIALKNELRKTLAQILGGVILLAGFYGTWQMIQISNKTLSVEQKSHKENLKVIREGQITERLTRAISQFGSDKFEISLGGIYALEKIAKDSEDDHWPIMEVLTACVRKRAHSDLSEIDKLQCVKPDLQAILTVIGRREHLDLEKKRGCCLNLEETNLRGVVLEKANLAGANLRKVNLSEAKLEEAILIDADLRNAIICKTNLKDAELRGAELVKTDLQGADLRSADLQNAFLFQANLHGAILWEANLYRAKLEEAILQETNLRGAILQKASLLRVNLRGADLSGAILRESYLSGADLQDANLQGADLQESNLLRANLKGADLRKTENLTIEQLSEVMTLYNSILDPEVEKKIKKKCPNLFEPPKTK